MDAAQKRLDFETSIKKPAAMTEDEIKKQKERKARELQSMLERAERAVEGNRRLLAKKKLENLRSSPPTVASTPSITSADHRNRKTDPMNGDRMAATLLSTMTTNAIESLSQEDLSAALALTNIQAGTDLTMKDLEAALILVNLSTSSTENPVASIGESKTNPGQKQGQANEIDSQRQERRNYMAAYQRQRRAQQPKGHRKQEYRKFLAKDTDSHRKERLRKRRERKIAKKAEGKRA
ncbi:MAG: hypothetical protein ASARMPRED_005567 [Alectoria sarmentosa]|nr:MAG: hypothetical protein ASARMPRED_005567 [Alectoria sarmentosa]